MTGTLSLGVADIELTPCTHICSFYRGARDFSSLLVAYFREGLKSGEKCLGLIDSLPSRKIASFFETEEEALRRRIDRQMTVVSARESYLTHGYFQTEKMLAWLTEHMSRALTDEGFDVVRAFGEMTWALQALPGVGELCAYEAELNRWLPSFPGVLLCMYDLDRFDGRTVVDVLKTHPRVLMNGVLLENPFYIPPDEFLSGLSPAMLHPYQDAIG